MKIINKILRYHFERICVDLRFLRSRTFLCIFNLLPDFYTLSPLRNLMLKLGGAQIKIFDAYIRSPLWCSDLKGLQFGKGIFINMGCRFEGTAKITIGDCCQIGPFCCFENVNHTPSGDQALPIIVGCGVWIGARVLLVPGVQIGESSVIAAGAVVTRKVPNGELWGGVPAKKIRGTLPVK